MMSLALARLVVEWVDADPEAPVGRPKRGIMGWFAAARQARRARLELETAVQRLAELSPHLLDDIGVGGDVTPEPAVRGAVLPAIAEQPAQKVVPTVSLSPKGAVGAPAAAQSAGPATAKAVRRARWGALVRLPAPAPVAAA